MSVNQTLPGGMWFLMATDRMGREWKMLGFLPAPVTKYS
jgi:hypothetical protein